MKKFSLTPREWSLFLFPCAILFISHADKFRNFDSSEIALALNPFARARENARQASCQSNLKQIGLGFRQYIQDYDSRFPLNATPKTGWVYLINPYTKSCPILHCPKAGAVGGIMIPDYWMNRNLNDPRVLGRGLELSDLDVPSHTYLLGDGDTKVSSGNYTVDEKTWQSEADYAKRHLFGANYLFADGHVKALKPDIVNQGRNLDACCTIYTFKTGVIKVGGPKRKKGDHGHNHAGHDHDHPH